MTRVPSLRIRILVVLVLAAGSAAGAVLTLEAFLRLTSRDSTSSGPATIVVDDALGWDANPAVAALGNHDSGPVVYFAGDSFTHSAKWPHHAQAVARAQGVEFRGYNLGVSGYGVTQSFLKVQREFDHHRPRLVVLQLYPWNDLRDDYGYPGVFYGPERSRRPYFTNDGSGFRLLPAPPVGRLSSWIGRSQIHQRVLLRAYLRATRIAAERDIDLFSRRHIAAHVHYHERASWLPFYLAGAQDTIYVRNAYAAFEHGLVSLRGYLAERGATLAVLAIGNAFTVDADVLQEHAAGSAFHPTLPEENIGRIAARHGIPFVSLVEPLRELARQRGAQVYDPPAGSLAAHLQPEAEEVVGRIAAAEIVKILPRAVAEAPGSRTQPARENAGSDRF